MSSEDIEQIRIKARALVERTKSDAAFRAQVEADPMGTLTAAGLPADAIGSVLQSAGIEAEVAGYSASALTCDNNAGQSFII
jgi:hypothetical protein